MKTTTKLTLTLITIMILFSSIIIYQQTQIQELKTNIQTNQYLKQYLLQNYGVSSIEELIQKKLKEYSLRYTGNPFTAALYPGQFQAENITGMHWYTYLAGQLQNRTDVLAYPSLPAKFIIENISGTIIWKDGINGTVYATGTTPTEATNIINWALGNLTSGRTWKEKVVLKGTFGLMGQIDLGNYTILDLTNAKLVAKNGYSDSYMIVGRSNNEIIGGVIDGNNLSYTTPACAIGFIGNQEIDNNMVMGVEIRNIKVGISMSGNGGKNNKILYNYIHNLYNNATYTGVGINIDAINGDYYDTIIAGNILRNLGYMTTAGIAILGTTDGSHKQYRVLVTNNIIGEVKLNDAIQLYEVTIDSVVSHNTIFSWDRTAIRVDEGLHNIITNNVIRDFNLADYDCTVGIQVTNEKYAMDCDYNIISSNILYLQKTLVGILVNGQSTNYLEHNKIAENIIYYTNPVSDRGAIEISYNKYPTIENNKIVKPRANGILVKNTAQPFIINNYIWNPGFSSGVTGHGIKLVGNLAVIKGNEITYIGSSANPNVCDAIYINGSNNIIEGNHLRDDDGYGKYFIEEAPGSDYNYIVNNQFIGTPQSGKIYKVGANTVIKRNKGFVTENSGTVTFSNTDTVVFVHGLAGTPTGVWVSFNNTGYGSWTWTANSTHITLTVTTTNYNGTAYWHAEYQP